MFRARGTRFGRDLALQLLPDGFSHDPERIARFRRRAEVLASLNQPDVGAIYELEQSRGAQAIVLELVGRRDDRRSLPAGPVPVSDPLDTAGRLPKRSTPPTSAASSIAI
jgi:hypothetical protein